MEGRDSRKTLNARYWLCCLVFNGIVLIGLAVIVAKAFCLQVLEHQVWVDRARAQTETKMEVATYRGSIYDVQGRLMSYSVPQSTLFSVNSQLENPKAMAGRLAPILGEPQSLLEKKLACNRQYACVKRQLTDQQAAAIESLNGKGLNLVDEYKRFYPFRQVAGQVLGFVGLEGFGMEGVEKSFDEVLRSKNTPVGQLRDGVKKCLWLQSAPPPESTESFGVRLTIDAFLQYLCEYELEKAVTQYRARAGEVVVMDPNTFEVLAMANWPFFDPNLSEKRLPDLYRNRVITDSFEPGSTFKVVMMSAALEENIVREKDRIFCENGKGPLAGHIINDTHPYGWLTASEVIKYSSNIGAGKLALQLGNERYNRYIRGFGFGADSGIALPGEVKGLVRPAKRWRPIDLATMGFGQGIAVTSMQLTTAIASIANGGEYAQPVIARDILDAQGESVKRIKAVTLRRVIQKKTALQLREMMRLVTQEGGTGTASVPEGYTVAGKTGTAQILDPQTKRYAAHRHTASFTGFIPADQPRLVITVVIHEPQGSMYGGVVSAPVFRNIAARALPYLGVMPAQNIVGPAPGIRSVKAGGGTKAPAAPAAPAAPPTQEVCKIVAPAQQVKMGKEVQPAVAETCKVTAPAQPAKNEKATAPPVAGKTKIVAPVPQIKNVTGAVPAQQVKRVLPGPEKSQGTNAAPAAVKRTAVKPAEPAPGRHAGYALKMEKPPGSKID